VRTSEVRHTVGKLSRRAKTLVWTLFRSEFGARSYECPKSHESKPGQFQDSTLGVPRKKNHLDASAAESCREYYMGEGGGFPRVQAVVSQVSPRSPVACPNTKSVQNEF
jgi:hypothetical protein